MLQLRNGLRREIQSCFSALGFSSKHMELRDAATVNIFSFISLYLPMWYFYMLKHYLGADTSCSDKTD